jgi:hypothetical protein
VKRRLPSSRFRVRPDTIAAFPEAEQFAAPHIRGLALVAFVMIDETAWQSFRFCWSVI